MSRKIEEQIEQLVGAKIEQMGYELVDVEYAKVKGQDDELVVYIDRQGGVTLDDCEAVSWRWSPSSMKPTRLLTHMFFVFLRRASTARSKKRGILRRRCRPKWI